MHVWQCLLPEPHRAFATCRDESSLFLFSTGNRVALRASANVLVALLISFFLLLFFFLTTSLLQMRRDFPSCARERANVAHELAPAAFFSRRYSQIKNGRQELVEGNAREGRLPVVVGKALQMVMQSYTTPHGLLWSLFSGTACALRKKKGSARSLTLRHSGCMRESARFACFFSF